MTRSIRYENARQQALNEITELAGDWSRSSINEMVYCGDRILGILSRHDLAPVTQSEPDTAEVLP